MAKEKRPGKRSQRPLPRSRQDSEVPPALPDRRAIEGVLRNVMGNALRGSAAEGPLDQSQDLMYMAFESTDAEKRVKLAQRALELSPDCADAYVVLAESAQSSREALEHYQKAVAAGERALGPRVFRDDVGQFWGLLETRPYMRGRRGLAGALWAMGRQEEAIGHLKEMLRLNPNDNQGVRYVLAAWLLVLERNEELGELLEDYPEETAHFSYNRALLAFRQQGDTRESRRLLKAAFKENKFVPGSLLGEEELPHEMPEYHGFGDRHEAIAYVAATLTAWKSTPGAVTWVEQVVRKPKKTAPRAEKCFGPSALGCERLKRLPRSRNFEIWQAGFRQMPTVIECGGEPVMPWTVLVANRTDELIMATRLLTCEPSSELLWDALDQAMQHPAIGDPHRPTHVQVERDARWEALRPHLGEIGLALDCSEELVLLRALFDDLVDHLSKNRPPGLLDVPMVTPERLAPFFQAAAYFYRRAPWRFVDCEIAVKIECDKFQSGPWYAVVMGQSGITLGLALYEDLKFLRKIWTGRLSNPELGRQTVALSVTFDPWKEINPKDLYAAKRCGWEVAGPEAYPNVFRKVRGMTIRPPLAWELELLEGCMRALPDFVSGHERGDLSRHEVAVPVAAGEAKFVFSWVARD
jgi:tetratricopeptide (TPR) repeat protein